MKIEFDPIELSVTLWEHALGILCPRYDPDDVSDDLYREAELFMHQMRMFLEQKPTDSRAARILEAIEDIAVEARRGERDLGTMTPSGLFEEITGMVRFAEHPH